MLLGMMVGFGVLAVYVQWLFKKQSQAPQQLEDIVNKVFGLSVQKVAEQSREILNSERSTITVDLENKQKSIEKVIEQLRQELKERQEEIRSLERDRTQKFSQVVTAIDEHRKITEKLETSAQKLARVLSDNQVRGEWGERIIEDLLTANGLSEGVHYQRQALLPGTSLKPDITLLLPNKRLVSVDVKFPYSEVQKMADAETKKAQQDHLRQFAADLRIKIKKVAEYIQPDSDTLDYAIMFVPNEMIFSFINQRLPDVVDEAMRQRVIIVSPFTFVIVARTVMESYRNFMMEDRLREVVKYIESFVKEWSMFKEEFEKFGRSIDTLKTGYEKLTTTRTQQMDRRLHKIGQYQQGTLLEPVIEE